MIENVKKSINACLNFECQKCSFKKYSMKNCQEKLLSQALKKIEQLEIKLHEKEVLLKRFR